MRGFVNHCLALMLLAAVAIVAPVAFAPWTELAAHAMTGTTSNGFAVVTDTSGSTTALKLSATIKTGTGDIGKTGKTFFLANYFDSWLLHNGSSWIAFDGKTIPSYSSGPLPSQTSITILTGQDVSGLGGLNFLAGYGDSAQEMVTAGRYKAFYTIPASSISSGGNSSSGSSTSSGKSKYTVMVYIVGSDLESKNQVGNGYATYNIQQMLNATSSDSVNLVLTTGGANRGGLGIDWTTVNRHIVKNGKLTTVGKVGRKNMADPATLTDFIVWAKSTYPADKYALVLWDHGGGDLAGFGKDELFNKMLSVPEMTQALKNANQQSGIKFDFIGFDACLMATVEIAYNFAPYSKYLVSSQAPEPGYGWDWKTLTNTIVKNPAIDPLTLGKNIADSYFNQCSSEQRKTATLSVVNLSKISDVVSAVDNVSQKIGSKLSATNTKVDNFTPVNNSRNDSIFAIDSSDSSSTSLKFSLVDLTKMYSTTKSLPSIASTYPGESKTIVDAVKQAVEYNVTGSTVSKNANGLSIFLPKNTDSNYKSSVSAYSTIDFSTNYKSMLGIYAANRSTAVVAPPSFGAVAYKNRIFSSKVTNVQNAVNPSIFTMLTTPDDASFMLIIGIDNAAMNTTTGGISYNFNQMFMLFNNNDIQDFVYSEYLFSNDSVQVYQAPVYINSQPMYLLFGYDTADGSTYVLGAFAYTDSGGIDKNIQDIYVGDRIAAVYQGYGDGGFVSEPGAEFYAQEDFTVASVPMPKGYILGGFFSVDDLKGKTYYSDSAVGLGKSVALLPGETDQATLNVPRLPDNFRRPTPADTFGKRKITP